MALYAVCTIVILGSTVFLGVVGLAVLGEIRAVPDAVCARLKAEREAEAVAARISR
jgi:hypothetical protein